MESKKKKEQNDPSDEEPSMPSDIQDSMDKVFGNPLLREKILKHVIYPSNNNQVNYKDVRNIRLVQKSWLKVTSRLLRKKSDPLFNLQTSVYNSVTKFLNDNEEKLLDSFVRTLNRPDKIERVIPLISLNLLCGFFVPENYEALSKFLVSCGSGLTSLKMMIPKSCEMSFLFPQFSLPQLQQLSINFVAHAHPVNGDPEGPNEDNNEIDVPQNNITVPYFFQQIFNSSNDLKTLEFKASELADSDVIPFGFDFLRLPTSVTTLLMKCPVLPKHLEMISRRVAGMPTNLSRLEITASEAPFPEDTINRILVRHRATLKTVKLSGTEFQNQWDVIINIPLPSLFKIPAMENLEKLSLSSSRWIGVNNLHMNSLDFSNLLTLKMKKVALALFEQFTSNFRVKLRSVKNLKIWLVNEVDGERRFETTLSLNGERMQRAHLAFSNVTNLDITVCGREICGLKYVFKEMVHLISLTIRVRTWFANLTCAAWDGLFIGAPEGTALALKDCPEYWPNFTLKPHINHPSIQRLKALSKLTLDSTDMPTQYGLITGVKRYLVSEVSFHYAFMKMPQLKHLYMFGRFQPNATMIDLWKKGNKSGESLVYAEDRIRNDI